MLQKVVFVCEGHLGKQTCEYHKLLFTAELTG